MELCNASNLASFFFCCSYALLGNSLSVAVVAPLLRYLFSQQSWFFNPRVLSTDSWLSLSISVPLLIFLARGPKFCSHIFGQHGGNELKSLLMNVDVLSFQCWNQAFWWRWNSRGTPSISNFFPFSYWPWIWSWNRLLSAECCINFYKHHARRRSMEGALSINRNICMISAGDEVSSPSKLLLLIY